MKFKSIVITVCILVTVLLQSTILDFIKIHNVGPNMLVVLIVSFALLRGNAEGAVIGFFCGLSLDILSGKTFGFYALLGMYLGLAVGSINKRVYRENILVVLLITFLSTILYETSLFFLGIFINTNSDFLFSITKIILPEALYNSIISIPIYFIVIKLNDKINEAIRISRNY